jgi:hypothetical protein
MRKPAPQNNSGNVFNRRSYNRVDEVVTKLQAAADDAVAVLHASLFDRSAAISIRAALAILDLGIISTAAGELERRISELERLKWKGKTAA